MKEKVYIARNYRSKFDAAGKAKIDCETILEKCGWRNIGFKQTWIANSIIGTTLSALGVTWALLRLKSKSTLLLQYPFNKFYRYSLWGAKLKNCEIVTLVHDVATLKARHLDPSNEIALLSRSDKLIVHNDLMGQWFREQGCKTDLVNIEAFDYLHTPVVDVPKEEVNYEKLRIVFAGNMGTKRSFIYDLDNVDDQHFTFYLYGVGFEPENVKNPKNTNLHYKGKFPANEVIDRIDGDFGLIWYGDSLDSCDGAIGQYLKYNNPHKLSLYILCGMPIVIWSKAAMAKFVTDNDIGITVDSLEDLPDAISKLTKQDIERMKAHATVLKDKLENGGYLSEALAKATQ